MVHKYREPTQAPRGPELVSLEGRKRVIANARLARYNIPPSNDKVVGHRQVPIDQGRPPKIGPYTSPVREGLMNLVEESMKVTSTGGV